MKGGAANFLRHPMIVREKGAAGLNGTRLGVERTLFRVANTTKSYSTMSAPCAGHER
jgi:hypothetical protein